MTIKAYINEDQTATFVCPECQKPRVANVCKYVERKEHTPLRVRCKCGHQYQAYLEKRKKFRKQANLPGAYKFTTITPDKKPAEIAGKMSVIDISFTGIRVKLLKAPRFAIGDKLTVEFTLDDANKSVIRKEVIVQNIKDLCAGFEYIFNQSYDTLLGFYLLSKR